MKKKFIQVFLDFQIGTNVVGRVTFDLFTDITPKTAENFRGLCTGEYGNVGMGKKTKKLHYFNSVIHRIVDGMCVQGGDITNADGTGGASIYGGPFVDENFQRRHSCAGLLSMANKGRNTNTSQFFITLKACPHLDGKHVVFGQVIDGMDVIKKIGLTRVDMQDRPVLPIKIINCGEVNDMRKHWNYDPFNKQLIDEYRERKWKILLDESSEDEELDQPEADAEQIEEIQEIPEQKNDPLLSNRLNELRERIHNAKVLNDRAVLQEEKLNIDAKFNEKFKNQTIQSLKEKEKKELEFKQISQEQSYLNKPCLQRHGYTNDLDEVKHGSSKQQSFGWDVFNDDAVYNAYKKRCTNLVKDGGLYQKQIENANQGKTEEHLPCPQALDRLSVDINKQIEKRKNFSRRRMFIEDEAVTYINERNRVFNRKLQRNFGAYAADIKANLERGTAH